MTSVSNFSKIDANLQEFSYPERANKVANLFLNSAPKALDVENTFSDYSNTLKLENEEYVCYQFSHEYTVLSLYSLANADMGRTIAVHFPDRVLNLHHTFTIREVNDEIIVEVILKDGLYLILHFPLNCVLDGASAIPENWFTVLNPYDFTVRQPQYAYPVDYNFTVVFLEDGGLLGLTRSRNKQGSYEVTPTLFNDNSYLQSLTKILFSGRRASHYTNVVSCTVYRKRFLITLTQNCSMKIWDLHKQAVIVERALAIDEKHKNKVYETLGQYLTLHEDQLAIFLPFENGMFQIWDFRLDSDGDLLVSPGSVYSSNLSSCSIWSLVDMKFTKAVDLGSVPGFINLVVLWRSNRIMKLQVLKVISENLKDYEWLEATNHSLMDMKADLNILTNGDTEQALMNIKAHYTSSIFTRAQRILSESGVLLSPESPYNHEYLLNLESVLKDLKKRSDEPSSLTLFQDEIIMVNSLSLYSHSLYKIDSELESIFYNLNEESSLGGSLGDYLRIIEGFASTLSNQVLSNVSDAFIDVMTSSFPSEVSFKEKFTQIFLQHLEGRFHMANLKKLYDGLSRLDVVSILNKFIDDHLQKPHLEQTLVDSLIPNSVANVALLQSAHQAILIQKDLVLKVLLIFVFLDFDYSVLQPQIKTLLALHYKQCLWVRLYQLDKKLLAAEMLARTSKYGNGYRIKTYADWTLSLTAILNEVYSMAVSPNPLFIEAFDSFILSGTRSSKLCHSFLKTVQQRFYIHTNVAHEFMLGLSFFMCGIYDRAFEFLQKHPYPEALPQELPDSLYMPLQKDGHLWCDVVSSFKLPYKDSAYYFNLSKLFSVAQSYEYALRCIKKSIKLSTELENVTEPQSFKEAQLTQYLTILLKFSNYEEILDVLRCSSEILSEDVRRAYYKKMLEYSQHQDAFFAKLLALCKQSSGLFLPIEDYSILDQLLYTSLTTNDWNSYKKLYAFRLINDHERAAAEALYHYVLHGKERELKNNCYLLIMNILKTFASDKDRWILTDGGLRTLTDLNAELNAL